MAITAGVTNTLPTPDATKRAAALAKNEEKEKEKEANTYRTPASAKKDIKPILPPAVAENDGPLDGIYFKLLLLGIPGMGKTNLATGAIHRLHPDMYPAALIDIESKAANMPALMPLRREGLVDVYEVSAPILPTDKDWMQRLQTLDHHPSLMPRGFLDAVDTYNTVSKDPKYKTIIFDPLSRLVEHLERTIEFILKKGTMGVDKEGKSYGGDFMKYRSLLAEFIDKAVRKADKHVIMTCHLQEQEKRQGQNVTISYRPAIQGAMRSMLVGYFDNAFFLRTAERQGQKVWIMDTQPSMNVPARTNIPGLDKTIDQDLNFVYRKWKSAILGLPFDSVK